MESDKTTTELLSAMQDQIDSEPGDQVLQLRMDVRQRCDVLRAYRLELSSVSRLLNDLPQPIVVALATAACSHGIAVIDCRGRDLQRLLQFARRRDVAWLADAVEKVLESTP